MLSRLFSHAASAPREGQALAAGDERAIIDIGSNTVRLVIFGGPLRAPVTLYNEKVTARLGRGVAEDGRMSDKAMRTALASLARYAALLRLREVAQIECVATAAVRDAANGPAFLARVVELGLSPRLLSGEEEALIGAGGVRAAFPQACGIVADLGGGSLELTEIGEAGISHGISMPLGMLRLAALRAGGAAKFAPRVHKMLAGAEWAGGKGRDLYLVGGSWRALARFAMDRDGWPIDDPHGFTLAPAAALKLARSLMAVQRLDEVARVSAAASTAKPDARVAADPRALAVAGISSARLAGLPDAAALLGVLVRELQPARLIFSAWGLREGLLASRFTPQLWAEDPLVIAATDFVGGIDGRIPHLAPLVTDWIIAVADAGAGGAASAPGDERLRLAATMLALASMRAEPNLRGQQATDWALHKRWIGINAPGRAMLAQCMRANHGKGDIPAELLRLASAPRLRGAQTWGLAVRLCRRFTGPCAKALAGTRLAIEQNQLILTAAPDFAMLYSEAIARDHRSLAEALALQAVFRVGEPALAHVGEL